MVLSRTPPKKYRCFIWWKGYFQYLIYLILFIIYPVNLMGNSLCLSRSPHDFLPGLDFQFFFFINLTYKLDISHSYLSAPYSYSFQNQETEFTKYIARSLTKDNFYLFFVFSFFLEHKGIIMRRLMTNREMKR